MQNKEIEKAYWQGYIAKQNEAIEICKICKYMKKARDLESENYEQNNIINSYIEEREKLIDKLEQDIEELEILNDNYIDANVLEGTYETLGRISEAKKILSIIKL